MVKYILFLCLLVSVNVTAKTSLVDPTKPLHFKSAVHKKKQIAALPKLQSILDDGKQRRAILNNQLYKTGQWIGEYQITAINRDTLFLRDKKRLYKLSLYTEEERFVK